MKMSLQFSPVKTRFFNDSLGKKRIALYTIAQTVKLLYVMGLVAFPSKCSKYFHRISAILPRQEVSCKNFSCYILRFF